MPEEKVGEVTHFFTDISVAVIELSGKLTVGDTIHVKGATTDFEQKVESMEIEEEKIKEARAGQSIGMKMTDRVREGDEVYHTD
ncbi:MAG: translation elongation factor-like protein [Candidatus Aenigmatarchaeota archaeon]